MNSRSGIRAVAKEYLQVIFHRKWLFLVPFLGLFVIVVLSGFFMPKVYESSNLILVEQVRAKNPLVTGLAVATTVKGHMKTLQQEIVSRSRLLKVIKALGMDKNVTNEGQLLRMVRQLQKNIEVEMVGTNLIQISCQGTDPRLIKRIVDATTKFFIEKNLELESREVETAIEFIQSQLEVYKKKLDEAEVVLKDFKRLHMLDLNASPGQKLSQLLGLNATINQPIPAELQSSNVNIDRLIDFQNQLLQVDVMLYEAQEKKHILEQQLTGQQEVIVSEVIKESSPVVKMLRQQQSDLEMELSHLLVDATEEHPRVKQIRQRLDMIRSRIDEEKELITTSEMSTVNPVYQELKSKLNDVELEINSQQAKKYSLEKLSTAYEAKIKELPEKELERIDIMREYAIASSMYAELLERLERARITKRLEILEKGTTFEVLDEAKVPIEPIKPNKTLITLLGLMLGLFVGSGMVFLAEYADSSFRGIEDARDFFKEPVLGTVSQIITEQELDTANKKRNKQVVFSLVGFGVIIIATYFITVYCM